MGSFAKAYRPRNIYSNGLVVKIDRSNMVWFDKFLHKYYNEKQLRRTLRNFPKIGAIIVMDGDHTEALITISRTSTPNHAQVDHFTGENNEADFSISMTWDDQRILFKDLSFGTNQNSFKQVSNFVMGVHVYEVLTHLDKNAKTDTITPFEVFGQPLV